MQQLSHRALARIGALLFVIAASIGASVAPAFAQAPRVIIDRPGQGTGAVTSSPAGLSCLGGANSAKVACE